MQPSNPNSPPAAPDPWAALRAHTAARIALGRAGTSLPTCELLAFQADHARAMDAVHAELDRVSLAKVLDGAGLDTIRLETAATSRTTYLQRPDSGRRLDDDSHRRLRAYVDTHERPDVVVAIVDGLSAIAAQAHAATVAIELTWKLRASGLRVGGVPLVRYGRVALQDELGGLMGARVVVSLIGERPGLGSPDSLGAYLVFNPRLGNTDAQRNCVSNIRPEGLPYDTAADTLFWLTAEALRRQISGVQLKDDRTIITPQIPGTRP
jgi:ethanolamine ammonia-lyase small subunit